MAKKNPPKKTDYSLQFLLPGEEKKMGTGGFLPTFAEKLTSEQIIRWDEPNTILNGYVVIFESLQYGKPGEPW